MVAGSASCNGPLRYLLSRPLPAPQRFNERISIEPKLADVWPEPIVVNNYDAAKSGCPAFAPRKPFAIRSG
jgi:hypothetical protein